MSKMQSPILSPDIIQGLQKSSKGKLQYDPFWHKSPDKTQALLREVSSSSKMVCPTLIVAHVKQQQQEKENSIDFFDGTADSSTSDYKNTLSFSAPEVAVSSYNASPVTSKTTSIDVTSLSNTTMNSDVKTSESFCGTRKMRHIKEYQQAEVEISRYAEQSKKLAKDRSNVKLHEAESQWKSIQEQAAAQLAQLEDSMEKTALKVSQQAELDRTAAAAAVSPETEARRHNLVAIEHIKGKAQAAREAQHKRVEVEKRKLARIDKFKATIRAAIDEIQGLSSNLFESFKKFEHKAKLEVDPSALVEAVRKVSKDLDPFKAKLDSDDYEPVQSDVTAIEQYKICVTQHCGDVNAKMVAATAKADAEKVTADKAAAEADSKKKQEAHQAATQQANPAANVATTQPPAFATTTTAAATPVGTAAAAVTAGSSGATPGDARLDPQAVASVEAECREEYARKMTLLEQTQKACESFMKDAQNKPLKNALSKAINIPINAISRQGGSQLLDKLKRLVDIASGQPVQFGGETVTATSHPQGVLFCTAFMAKKLVKQGEEQVASSPESAFPFAAVILGLWARVPQFGDLYLAYLYKSSPYLVPYCPPKPNDMQNHDYYRLLGYTIQPDNTVEPHDKFLKRLAGHTHLFGALCVTSLPRGVPGPHPLTLDRAWTWLAKAANSTPRADVTPTLLYELLAVTGSSLLERFGAQALKLCAFIADVYLPVIKQQALGAGGPVSRLDILLDSVKKTHRLDKPQGVIEPSFWYS